MSEFRPLFTGDVLVDVPIPGVQEGGGAIVLAHPCSMRGRDAKLVEGILVGAVGEHEPVPARKWEQGFFNRMPLPELDEVADHFAVGWLDRVGLATSAAIQASRRFACLSPIGVNILQQRLVGQLTRVDVPTSTFWEAFGHTYEEADLLEEWTEMLADITDVETAAADFDAWLRSENRQDRLKDPQQRATIRSAMRKELHDRRS